MAAILELREVSKHYPGHRAVHNVSLQVEAGAFYSILGPSGCGKTTTLRLVAGFDDPTSGEILLDGKPVQNIPPFERPVNTVFQRYALFPHLTVQGNVEFGLKRRGVGDCAAKVAEALDLVHLTGKEQRMPSQLSGGEQQRVALARSLVLEPRVVLLDEPLSALDPALRKSVRAELKALQRRTGITFVFITHDQEEALSLSDRIAVMNKGEVEQIGSPQDIYLRPATPFVATFLGDVNWIDASKLGVRPESTRIGREAPADMARIESGQVRNSVFLGHCFHVETETARGRMVAEADQEFKPGEAVFVWWHASDECGSMHRLRAWFLLPARVLNLICFVIPLCIVLAYSLLSRGVYGGVETPWTFENYQRLFDPLYFGIFLRSFLIAGLSTFLCLLLGFPLAWFIARSDIRRRNLYLNLVMIPFWTSFLVRTYAWMFLLRDTGLINTVLLATGIIAEPLPLLYNNGAVLLGLVYGYLPFMVLPLYTSLEKIDRSMLEAAADLGATPSTAFWQVVVPLAKPGMRAGSILVFISCIGTYLTPDLLGGSKTIMIGNVVQNQFTAARDWPFGAACSLVLMGLVMLFLRNDEL